MIRRMRARIASRAALACVAFTALAAPTALTACSSSSAGQTPDAAVPDAAAPDPRAGTWHVRGSFVRDPDGRAVIMRGVNFTGENKSPPTYFGPETAADAKKIGEDFGMNAVRLLAIWAAIEPQRGVYDDKYLDALAERVAWMEAQGILVIIDLHQDLYGEGFYGDGAPKWSCDQKYYDAFKPQDPWFLSYTDPNMTACYDGFWNDVAKDGLQDHYVESARRLAKGLAGSKAVIGIDPMNEPYWGSAKDFEQTKLLPLYQRTIAAVRGEAPSWIAFAEPSSAHNLGLGTTIESFPFDNVAFSPHAYDTNAESGKGFDPNVHDAFAQRIASFMDEAKLMNAAMWIGEYGGTPNVGIASYMDAAYMGAGMVAASTMYWSYGYGGGYSLLNPDGTERSDLVDAIVRPYPMRLAGEPSSYAYDVATKTFTTTWTHDPSIAAPTLISVPPRIYPGGYVVTCAGCATEKTAGVLRVTSAPAGVITLTLKPG
jgi:endoglycosylceramidase